MSYGTTSKEAYSQIHIASCRIFNSDLVAIEMSRVNMFLNRPMYIGEAILDVSKVLMQDFYYNFLYKKYGERLSLCMSDTDSLLIFLEGVEDIYEDFKSYSDKFDFSNYPNTHPNYSVENKGKVLVMKDETCGTHISHFTGILLLNTFLFRNMCQQLRNL